MVSIDPDSRRQKGGVTIPTKCFIPLALLVAWMSAMQAKSFLQKRAEQGEIVRKSSYQEAKPILHNPDQHRDQCKLYIAESAMAKNAGLGVFTGVGRLKGEEVSFPDICIFLGDSPNQRTQIRSHTFGFATFFGQFEGKNSRAACEGVATIFNTNKYTHVNTKLLSPVQATIAGTSRYESPSAGSITHHYGVRGEALDVIPAGQELAIWYGDWDDFFEDKQPGQRPGRDIEWLNRNGWCVDHVEIRESTIKGAGRGAFMKRGLPEGATVLPAPLQMFKNRNLFQNTNPEQLYVNYCLQPKKSNMLFFPYGPAVGTINHSQKLANVRYEWSTHPLHRADMLDMNYRQFWDEVYPGALILEVKALRDLHPGEELFMDYGEAWQMAWDDHVHQWQKPMDDEIYVYPEQMDETEPLRTVKEQEINPYPKNLITMCVTPDHDREEYHIEWYEPQAVWDHAEWMVYCHILDRTLGENGDFEYEVSLLFYKRNYEPFTPEEYEYDPTVPREELYIDSRVPRRAIRWSEKPYMDDEHQSFAFRHPIEFPADLVPKAWETIE